jgi:hypothetical protein
MSHLGQAALEEAFRRRMSDVCFVAEHIVRRAVREVRSIGGLRTFVPHTQCLSVRKDVLTAITSRDELAAIEPLPSTDRVILLPFADTGKLAAMERDQALRQTWRLVFHARMDEALERLFASEGPVLSAAEAPTRPRVLETIDRIGQLPMEEARSVLAEEGLTGPHSDPTVELVELVSTWHELRVFSPEQLGRWFPSLVDKPEAVAFLDGLLPVADLLEASRPEGLEDPRPPAPPPQVPRVTIPLPPPELEAAQRALEEARRAHGRRLDVPAAVASHRARLLTGEFTALSPKPPSPKTLEEAVTAERRALTSLGERLSRIVADPRQRERAGEWPAALAPLLPLAGLGMSRVEARLLHDLERACHDAERETWNVDLGRVIRSFGRRPLKRREHIRERVTVVRSLLRAAKRAPLCRLEEQDRRRLKRLLDDLAASAEAALRAHVTPLLAEGLASAGLHPEHLPEQVARDKILAELCDRLLDRGFIAFSDLRDLIARNQLKLPDLAGPGDWLLRDPLLVLDRWCTEHLDGAYRPGEVYRSGLQRLSSLLFANRLGRLLVRFLILPFGGAFFLVQGLEHILGPLVRLFAPIPNEAVFHGVALEMLREQVHLVQKIHVEHHYLFWSIPSFLATSLVLFALIHSHFARGLASRAMARVGAALRFVFVELPRRFRAWGPIVRLVETRTFLFVWNRLWRPARYAALPTLIVTLATGDPWFLLWVGVPLILAGGFLLASRYGHRFSEAVSDSLTLAWHHIQHELVPGLIAATLAFFKRLMEFGEVALYNVDLWLRFQRGDTRLAVVLKAFFGFLWSIVAYLIRLMVTLVVEPQVNPIKHFPVVTVSHKVTIPTTLLIAHELKPFIGPTAANIIGGLAQFIIPGICGFLVWEFKENWRLYRSNRSPNLEPVIVGAHGEPVYRLLRLGFHSGTLPRIFRKLRKAERKGNALEIRKQTEELHHVEEAVGRFIERDLKALLVLDGRIPEARELEVETVRLTPARITVAISCRPLGDALEITFEEQSRHLLVGLSKRGFLDALPEASREVFEAALEGLYKLAGVDLVREQVQAMLPGRPGETPYDIGPRGLVVWPEGFEAEIVYPLRTSDSTLVPRIHGRTTVGAPAIAAADIKFKQRPISWERWTARWGRARP